MRWILGAVLLAAALGVGWLAYDRLTADDTRGPRERTPAPVSAAPIERGPLTLHRTWSGTLESSARFVVAPKVAGRIEKLTVDLADPVERGQIVAHLDAAEFEQAVEQARAELAVADATVSAARKTLQITEREYERATSLGDRGVLSASTLDTAKARRLEGTAAVEVARAEARRARSALEAARIRLGYTQITADWPDPDTRRVVAERLVDAGETVAANTPLMSIVDLDPLTGVIYASETDYPRLEIDREVELVTDAWPDRRFAARVHRIAPVFRENSRQARVELRVDNPDEALKPGMFIRATIPLARVDDALIVPVEALVVRGGEDGVFIVDDQSTARWRPVRAGIRDRDRVQITGDGLTGRVVTLGQQLLDDGSPVVVTETGAPPRGGSVASSAAPAAGVRPAEPSAPAVPDTAPDPAPDPAPAPPAERRP
ncbi:MAG: efflux RND transporter periplasmic adaptor subunit [Myxococcales bacterium]|nr:efflux RND transporter periplasmic adaptor subunit [Myxococcales bacterium]